MIILRENANLTLINTVRLDDYGLEILEHLGQVKHVIKLGDFHGMDDRFYVDRYQADFWAMRGMEHAEGLNSTQILSPAHPLPVSNASFFAFETSKRPEGIIHLHREEGILITCDSLQNWTEVDQFFNENAADKMVKWGFIQMANIGPGWFKTCQPEASDFERINGLEYRHLIPSHGVPLRDIAKVEFSKTFKKRFHI